jgi:hypothetical protein
MMNLTTGSDASFLKDELNKDEKLLWSGHPDPNRAMKSTMGIFLFGIPWTAFSIFWVAMAGMGVWSNPGKAGLFNAFPLFGLPFVLIGLGILSSPWVAANRAKNTHYGVTDKRVIILITGKTKTVQHFALANLTNPSRTEYGTKGDLCWSQTGQTYNYSRGINADTSQVGSSAGAGTVVFTGIDKPREVERLVEDAQARLSQISGGTN